MLNPASALYPQATTTLNNGFGQANNVVAQQFNSNQYDAKIDFNLSERDRFFGRYSWGNQKDPNTNSFQLLGDQVALAHLKNGVVNWAHTFTPSLLNVIKAIALEIQMR